MRVNNTHTRVVAKDVTFVSPLLATLATKEDKIWPTELWPAMRFRDGIKPGTQGGHGPIKYTVTKLEPNRFIEFTFTRPLGFEGVHWIEITPSGDDISKIKHCIKIHTTGLATLKWIFLIRPLHDALIEDAFDKIENQFSTEKKNTPWSLYVKSLRWMSTQFKIL
jgi:hypothetical protein